MLSPKVQARLEAARLAEKSYCPNDAVCAQLQEKTLVMFVGPVAVGKSFLMNHVTATDALFSRVPVFTTREPRADDEPGMFRCVPHDDAHVSALLDTIEAREIVQYIVHPTDRIYGSTIKDYPNRFNLLPTLSPIIDTLRQLPFQHTVVIGLACDPDVWIERLNDRYPEPSSEKTKRVAEAVSSLDWLLADSSVIWIDNTSHDPRAAVQAIINIVKYNEPLGDESAHTTAQAMMRRITEKEL